MVDSINPVIELVRNPTDRQWKILLDECLGSEEDIRYINRYPFAGARTPDGRSLILYLQQIARVWLIQEDGLIKGFINYGEMIPGHRNAFGMVIGKKYSGKGLASRALAEFVRRKSEWAIKEISGYCHRENLAMIAVMENNGLVHDQSFQDPRDDCAVKYDLKSASAESTTAEMIR